MTGRFVKRFQTTCQVISLLLITALLLHAADKKDPLGCASVQNFAVPDAYPDNPNQLRSILTGKSARSINEGKAYQLTEGELKTYDPDGKTNLVLTTPECIWSMETRIASSTNRLDAYQGDKIFRIKGVGWSWSRSNLVLIISNQV